MRSGTVAAVGANVAGFSVGDKVYGFGFFNPKGGFSTLADDGQPNPAVIALKHLFTEEIYTPSSYHALRGYKMLDVSFTEFRARFLRRKTTRNFCFPCRRPSNREVARP